MSPAFSLATLCTAYGSAINRYLAFCLQLPIVFPRASIERHLFLTAFFGCVQPQTGRVQRHTQAPHSVFP